MDVPYSDIEWTIENFSCWTYQIHTNKISLPKIELVAAEAEERFLELFPRGVSCREEHICLRFCNEWFFGDLKISFIGPDGSVIKTESIIIRDPGSRFYIGPTFETCVASIRENEPFHKDSLTLRFQKRSHYYSKCHVRLVIGVFNASMKINSKIFKEMNSAWNHIFSIEYPCEFGVLDYFRFSAFKIESGSMTNVKFKFEPLFVRSARSIVKVSTFHQLGKGAIVMFEAVEHMVTRRCEQVGLKSIPIVKNRKLNHYIILRLKIIRENPVRSHNCTSFYPCEIEMDSTNSSKILTTAASLHHDSSVQVLTKELKGLYQDRDFCDFQLRCDQMSFPVHKGILSARSPVFKSMLSSNMSEAVTGSMKIDDLDPQTLNSFLSFLYSGAVDDLQWDKALKLYYAADKYQVDTLKMKCVTVLCEEVSVSNICEILLLADRHQDYKLTLVSNDFLVKNFNLIYKTKEWMEFIYHYSGFLGKL